MKLKKADRGPPFVSHAVRALSDRDHRRADRHSRHGADSRDHHHHSAGICDHDHAADCHDCGRRCASGFGGR